MALTLVDGVDLRAVLASLKRSGGRFPVAAALRIVTDIALALGHAHARGIVHRDVSPGNILVSVDGAVQLTDFGIAKVAKSEKTRSGIVKGKAEYMSPEQAMGETVDGRADLFSLGVLLFELLAGQRPFDGPTPLAAQLNATQGIRPRLETLAPARAPELVAIVDRLLHPDRNLRYRDARTACG
jgi:serine/threonine-protein kinase